MFEHPSIVMADDLETFERLKLHILNLGHTVLAEEWLRRRRNSGETVRQMLGDPVILAACRQHTRRKSSRILLCTTCATKPLDMCKQRSSGSRTLFEPPYVGYRVEPSR